MKVQLIACPEFIWGTPDDFPALPQGFELKIDPNYWLTAKGPDGREWFVGPNRLTLAGRFTAEEAAEIERKREEEKAGLEPDELPTIMRCKEGEIYADGRTRIPLTPFGVASIACNRLDNDLETIAVGPMKGRFRCDAVECPICGRKDAHRITSELSGYCVIVCRYGDCRSNDGIADKYGAKIPAPGES